MTQQHDDAQAAIHSLRAALLALDGQRQAAQREQDLAMVEAADGLRSQTYGGRGSGGRPGDPTAAAALTGSTEATSSQRLAARVEQLAASVTATLQWLVTKLGVAGGGGLLDQLAAAVSTLSPANAGQLALWIGGEDYRIRRALGLPTEEYLTAEQLAARLTTDERPITADRIRDWARRSRRPGDRLHGLLPAVHTPGQRTGSSWYRMRDAELVATLTARGNAGVDDQAA